MLETKRKVQSAFFKFDPLRKIKTYDGLKKLSKSYFDYTENYQYTKYLNLNNCSIEIIDDNAFQNLPFLLTISLSYNKIKQFKWELLQNQRNLKRLLLSNNYISKLYACVDLESLNSVEKLVLNNNQIESLDENCFQSFKNLKSLNSILTK